MSREDYLDDVLTLAEEKKCLLVQWPTGFGKTKCALEILNKYIIDNTLFPDILVVIPKLVLIDSWKDEITKWLGEDKIRYFTFTTYVSFYKYAGQHYDAIVFDECHHFTDNCLTAMKTISYERVIALSATVKKEPRQRLYAAIPSLWYCRVSTRRAIDEDILPDPTVFLVPLSLKDVPGTFTYVRNAKGKKCFRVSYESRGMYQKTYPKPRLELICTATQYYEAVNEDMQKFKNLFNSTQQMWAMNLYKNTAGQRLKWLSEIKTPLVKDILPQLEDYRTLTFCSTIAQTEELGKNTIHSKNKEGLANLEKFNKGEENHITAVAVLNEGVNLSSCQVGIFAGLNASEIMVKQRLGRLLRHRHPLIILPYFVGTRDEEIVNKMKEDYNPDLTKYVYADKVNEEIRKFIKDETDN